MKSPIRKAVVDFEGDFKKLQKAVQEVGHTLEKAEVELEQKAMQQVCEAAAGMDAEEAERTSQGLQPEDINRMGSKYHKFELKNLTKDRSTRYR